MKRSFLLLALGLRLQLAYGDYCGRTCNSYDSAYYSNYPSSYGDGCYFYFDLEVGDYRLDAPAFSFGEILSTSPAILGAGIAPLPETKTKRERIDSLYPKFTFGIGFPDNCSPCWLGSNFRLELAGFYLSNEKQDGPGNGIFTSFALPNIDGSGDFIAAPSPLLLLPPNELSGVDVIRKNYYTGVSLKLASDMSVYLGPKFTFSPFVEFDFNTLFQRYQVNVGSVNGLFGTVATNFFLDERLQTHYYDFGIGFDFSYTFNTSPCSLFIFGEGAAFISSGHTHLKGSERAFFPFSGTIPVVRVHNDRIVVRDKERGQLGLGYKFCNFAVALMGQVERWGYMPRIKNPHRVGSNPVLPDINSGFYDRPASIFEESAFNYAVVLKLIMTLQ